MLQYEVLKHELNEKQAALDELKDALGLERLREEVEMLENMAAEPGFTTARRISGRADSLML